MIPSPHRSALVVVGAGLLLAGCGAAASAQDLPATVSAPRAAVTDATFAVVDGADAVGVRTTDLGGDLYRVTTADGARVRPVVTEEGGLLHLHLTHRDGPGPAAVEVALSSAVRWRLEIDGGTGSLTADLRSGRVSGVDVVGGSGRVELALPAPHGTVPVRLVGGTSLWRVTHPAGVAVRARAGAGAGSMDVDGEARDGVAAGTELATPGWGTAVDRYDLDAAGGVAALVVSARTATV